MLDSRGRLAGWQGWQASSIADMLPVWAQDICHGGGGQSGLQCFDELGIEETFHDFERIHIFALIIGTIRQPSVSQYCKVSGCSLH